MADFKISRIKYTWKGAWAPTRSYVKDDIVSYGGKAYVCFSTHTSAVLFLPDLNNSIWVLMFDGYTWRNNWTITTLYNPGDLVRYNGFVYRCLVSHTSSNLTTSGSAGAVETTSGLEANIANWEIVAQTHSWENTWAPNTRYKKSDIVKYGATVYKCNTAHTSAPNSNAGLENNISLWDIVLRQSEYTTSWTTGGRYKVGDIVRWGGTLWQANTPHSATTFATDLANWSVYLDGLQIETSGWSVGTTYQQGDVVRYGGYAYRAKQNNIGQTPSVVASVYWELSTESYNFRQDWSPSVAYRVGDIIRLNGYTYSASADNQGQEPPNATYWEQTNLGHKWQSLWLAARPYKLGDLVAYGSNTYECLQAHVANSLTRPDTEVAGPAQIWKLYVEGSGTNVMTTQGDTIYYNSGAKTRLPIGTEGQVLRVSNTGVTWTTYGAIFPKVYYVAPTGTDDVANNWGRTLDRPFRTVRYACANVTGPATIFIKTGVYSEILPISIPANVALVGDELRSTTIQPASGYTTSNMFYVRNGCGIRNMTLQGLSGTLGAANTYLTRRPTAGAYVSLDPGTGPADTSVHITTRSPYIQNVTTLGTGCVGMKVDGSLHQSGNRSIVANDFTQVLSDSIGMWITNGGLSELVSVFTYYCHIGYLSENGGKIRATNGNNSYGDFGSVSEGTLASETPVVGAVNNIATPAHVGLVLCNGTEILTFEYDNAGKNYDSTTTFNIVGTGLGATISASPTRNGGVSEVRIVDPGNPAVSAYGSGYLNVVNNAQSGSASAGTIYLAGNDTNLSSNYIGLRIIIISGRGTGQYGYISAYSASLKLATILKESDNTAGWDHVVVGNTPVDLDTTSQYSIEPRLTFAAPATGVRAQGRAVVASGRIAKFRIWEPGSGYSSAPALTVHDPNRGDPVSFQVRINDGVLGQPTWSSRGTAFLTATATVLTGTGYQDAYQIGPYLVVSNLTSIPGPGANVTLAGNPINYRLVAVSNTSGGGGVYSARLQLSPSLELATTPAQSAAVSIRINYSQTRLTGHDFLEIGTGNFATTNYPNQDVTTVKSGQLAVENGGGRVFYTATDQDGNFRVGNLFKVEQASGIATLNASFFDLNGLTQLTLGGIVLGGTSATISEISTDPTLPANSDGVIVTQRALKAYISSKIGGGSAQLNANTIVVGNISLASNQITSTTRINFKNKVNFTGGVSGSMLALSYFASSMRNN